MTKDFIRDPLNRSTNADSALSMSAEVSPRQTAVTEETAWVIEIRSGSDLRYYAPTQPGEWTSDHLKACRFSRQEDAEAIEFRHVARGHLPERDTRVCEHMWFNG